MQASVISVALVAASRSEDRGKESLGPRRIRG